MDNADQSRTRNPPPELLQFEAAERQGRSFAGAACAGLSDLVSGRGDGRDSFGQSDKVVGHSHKQIDQDVVKIVECNAITLGLRNAVWVMALTLLLSGCASDGKPKRDSHRTWYQGEMDSEERSFFVDSFFNGR